MYFKPPMELWSFINAWTHLKQITVPEPDVQTTFVHHLQKLSFGL